MGDVISGIGQTVGDFVGDLTGQNRARRDAIDLQSDATRSAQDTLRQGWQDQQKYMDPYAQAGGRALSDLASGDFKRDFTMQDFQKDPGYDFRMQQGLDAIQKSAAARGGLQSGATLKALTRYGQDFASNEFQNAYNRFNADRDRRFGRLSSLAGMGQDASTNLANLRGGFASQYAGNRINLGNARAGARIAEGNQTAGIMGQLGGAAMGYLGGMGGGAAKGAMAGSPSFDVSGYV